MVATTAAGSAASIAGAGAHGSIGSGGRGGGMVVGLLRRGVGGEDGKMEMRGEVGRWGRERERDGGF